MMNSFAPAVAIQLPASLEEAATGLPLGLLAGVALVALILGSLFVLFVTRYKRCPANKVLVISGKVGAGKSAKTLSGGGAFIWPVIQQYDYLSLLPITVEVNLTDALSFENIRVRVPSVFTVAIGHTEEMQQNAAMRLLGLTDVDVKNQAADIIFGQMRQVIASMEIEKINRDRESFLKHIQEALEPELKKLGLVLLNVNIKDLTDDSGYIEAIGQKAAAEAVQKARGDVAEEEKEGEKRVANATQERAIAVANAGREREIGVKSAERDQAVKVAELDKETAIARQRAEFERDTPHPVIALITEWRAASGEIERRSEASDKGGTMRLGAQRCLLKNGSLAAQVYGADAVSERHRHRYEFNNNFLEAYRKGGMRFSGFSHDGLVEILELPDHAQALSAVQQGRADAYVIDLAGKSSMCDSMIIASGRSHRHVAAMADHLRETLKTTGEAGPAVEGLPGADWVLIDAGDVIVHLFRPEVRSFYNLEKMWGIDLPAERHAPVRSHDGDQ